MDKSIEVPNHLHLFSPLPAYGHVFTNNTCLVIFLKHFFSPPDNSINVHFIHHQNLGGEEIPQDDIAKTAPTTKVLWRGWQVFIKGVAQRLLV